MIIENSVPPVNNNEGKSFWKNCTKLERTLICLATFLIVLVVTILIVFLTKSNLDDPKICLSPSCVKSAAQILENINMSVDPCEDFYEFTCGNFLKTKIIPEYRPSITIFSMIEELVTRQVNQLLKQPISLFDPRFLRLAKTFYESCINKRTIEENSQKNLLQILNKIGTWPLLVERSKWDENNFDWELTTYKFMKLGLGSDFFFRISVDSDYKNSSKKVLMLDQPHFDYKFLTEKGFNQRLAKAYQNYMVEIVVALEANRNRTQEELKDSLNLETIIAHAIIPDEDRRNISSLYNLMTFRQLEEKYKNISWLKYFNTFLYPVKQLTYEDTIIVMTPKYFEQLPKILGNTPKRIIANYMFWKSIQGNIEYLNGKMRKVQGEFLKIVSGESQSSSRWFKCTRKTISNFNLAVSSLYVKNFFNEKSKRNVEGMVENIKRRFIKILEQSTWIDKVTKGHALEKVGTMTSSVGYPIDLKDDSKVDDYYKNLTLLPNDYLGCNLNITLFSLQKSFLELDNVVERNDWTKHAHSIDINAYYNQNQNNIELSASILQGAFFDNERPQYMNYGGIGFVIGHEISHAFDDQGKQYDKNGNFRDWWQPETQNAFTKKVQCIIEQYNNITLPEINLNINGVTSQGENIADNGGIKHAYLAYTDWIAKNGLEAELPGLPFTSRQMFWISMGNAWCGKYRKEELKNQILADSHVYNHYRVVVPLLNSGYFAEDFKCPLGSGMNPPTKCTVW